MNTKIFWQVIDKVRANSALTAAEIFELALQILVWAKLSAEHKLPLELRLETAMSQEPGRAVDVLIRVGKESAEFEQAFSNAKRLCRMDSGQLRQFFDLVVRLTSTGLLESVDPTEVLASLPPSIASGLYVLPAELAMLIVELAELQTGETLYVPWDHSGQIAAFGARHHVEVFLETPIQSTIPVLVGLLAGASREVHYGDPIRSPSAIYDGGKLHQFDAAIAFPPFGQRYNLDVVDQDWFGRFPERTQSGSVLAVRHLLAQARRRVVIAVQNSLLFSAGAELILRESLLKCGNLQAVIGMPAGLLTSTSIPFSVLVLDPAGGHQRVTFVNADTPRFRDPISKARAKLANLDELIALVRGTVDTEDSKIVEAEDVLINGAQLQVSRYVRPASELQLQAWVEKSETVSLGDLVSTFRPMPTVSGNADGIEVHEIGAADLPAFGYVITPGRKVKVEHHALVKNKQQFLQPHDIVLIVKGSVGKVGIVPPDVPPPGAGGWVAGQSAIVLRADPGARVDPRALAVQLRSPLGRALVNGIVSGASIPLIQLKELNRFPVLIPDMETARRAVEALEREARLQADISRLQREQAECSAQLWQME